MECALCLPPSPPLRPSSSTESLDTQVHDSSPDSSQNLRAPPILRKTDTNCTLPTNFSGASTNVDSETEPDSPTIEKHPLFQNLDQKRALDTQWRYGRNQGETCASCSFSVPKAVAEKLPAGAPGSKRPSGSTGSTGAPVLRSREFVCLRERKRRNSSHHATYGSKPSSYGSSVTSSEYSHTSSHTHSHHSDDCHDHNLTYLTAKSPIDPEDYAQLRASVIRTLSCELLPRGMSDGPFCFGDPNTGYTIAYVFRLPDPKARGRRRAYAFLALAGKDASRAFQACPMLWESFKRMAKGIETAAQRHQDRQRQKEASSPDANKSASRNYTPISSFLAARNVDPDGHPRRGGQAAPRSLAEIVGDENIFTFLHQYFVAILRCLGNQFGGTPLVDQPLVYQSSSDEVSNVYSADVAQDRENRHKSAATTTFGHDPEQVESLRDDDATPTPHSYHTSPSKTRPLQHPRPVSSQKSALKGDEGDDIDLAKVKARKGLIEKDKNKTFVGSTAASKNLTAQCAVPMAVTEPTQRQVVV